jgi:hypothetical protein
MTRLRYNSHGFVAAPFMYYRTHRVAAPRPGTCNAVGLIMGMGFYYA